MDCQKEFSKKLHSILDKKIEKLFKREQVTPDEAFRVMSTLEQEAANILLEERDCNE